MARCAEESIQQVLRVEAGAPKRYFVKKQTRYSLVQMTRWNEGDVKTTYQQMAPNEWKKIEDREILNIHQNFDDKVNLIAVVHGPQLKMPPSSERPKAPIMNPQQKRTMSASQRRVQRENVARICVADDA